MTEKFTNLAQLMAYGYTATFPCFVPVQSGEASLESQQQMYRFMKSVANTLYSNPSLLGLPSLPDDCYDDWQLQNSKPKPIEAMRKIGKKIEEFYQLLLKLGELGIEEDGKLHIAKANLKLAPKSLAVLEGFGLAHENRKEELVLWSNAFPDLISGWKLLAANASASQKDALLLFSHCMFHPDNPYCSDIFLSLTDNKEVWTLLQTFFEDNGYRRIDNREKGISLDWVKDYGKKDEPLKASWGERTHGGLSICFDIKKKNPVIFGLRVPQFRELLAHFDEMADKLKEFTLAKTKKCDGCGYCTQTDKTGCRKRLTVPVSHHGEYELCTLFPGFSYVWTNPDRQAAEGMIGFLKFADQVLSVK